MRLLVCMAALAALGTAGAARAQNAAPIEAPDVLVKNVTLEVIDILAKDKEIQAGNRGKLIELIEAKVLPHFNFNSMTALALGQSWSKASADQKKKLTDEFKTLLVRTYASAIGSFSGERFDFRPLRAKPSDTDVIVNVRVLRPGTQPVPIDYAMEKTAAGWKVYDVMVGGVSLVANYRTEFSNVVRASGIDGLIKNLQTKNQGAVPSAPGLGKK